MERFRDSPNVCAARGDGKAKVLRCRVEVGLTRKCPFRINNAMVASSENGLFFILHADSPVELTKSNDPALNGETRWSSTYPWPQSVGPAIGGGYIGRWFKVLLPLTLAVR